MFCQHLRTNYIGKASKQKAKELVMMEGKVLVTSSERLENIQLLNNT